MPSSSSSSSVFPSAITLTRVVTKRVPGQAGVVANRMLITASIEGEGDPAIFAYQVNVVDKTKEPDEDGRLGAMFSHVVSPYEYVTLNIAEPTEETEYLKFRAATLDLLFQSFEEMEEVWTAIKADRDLLVSALGIAGSEDTTTETG